MARLTSRGRAQIKNVKDVTVSNSAPANPYKGQSWTDTSKEPPVTKIWSGTAWVDKLGELSGTVKEQTEKLSSQESRILKTEKDITLKVAASDYESYKVTVNGEITSAKSRLLTSESSIKTLQGQIALKVEQTDINKLETTINGKLQSYATTENMKSEISAAKNEINLSVSRTYAKQDAMTGVESRLSSAETALTLHAKDIGLMVKESDINGNYLIGKINLSSTTATIAAKNIKLEGLVTANNNFKILADGSIETINGKFKGKIEGSNISGSDITSYKAPVSGLPGSKTSISGGKLTVECGHNLASGEIEWVTTLNNGGIEFVDLTTSASKLCSLCYNGMSIIDGSSGIKVEPDSIIFLKNGCGIYVNSTSPNIKLGGSFYVADFIYEGGTRLSSKYAEKTHNHSGLYADGVGMVTTSATAFRPVAASDGAISCGQSSVRWSRVYATNATISTSDLNEKCNIKNLDDRYEQLFMKLRPVSYRWRNFKDADKHDRTHTGLIAQEVEEAALECGLSPEEFAAICIDNLEVPTADGRMIRYGLAYEEFMSLIIRMVQKVIKEVEEMKKERRRI